MIIMILRDFHSHTKFSEHISLYQSYTHLQSGSKPILVLKPRTHLSFETLRKENHVILRKTLLDPHLRRRLGLLRIHHCPLLLNQRLLRVLPDLLILLELLVALALHIALPLPIVPSRLLTDHHLLVDALRP